MPVRFPVRDDDRPPLRYRVVTGALRWFFRPYFWGRLDLDGLDRIPGEGPVLVASNHLSLMDPFLMGAFSTRTLFAMAKKELFAQRWVAWVLRGCNSFPVDRGAPDRQALRTALALLQGGHGLLVYVEGTRATTPGMWRAEPGVGFLARRSGAPVIPVAVWGTEKAWTKGALLPRRVDIHVRVGRVMTPEVTPGQRDDQGLADSIAREVAALLPAAYRGYYSALGG